MTNNYKFEVVISAVDKVTGEQWLKMVELCETFTKARKIVEYWDYDLKDDYETSNIDFIIRPLN